MTSRLAVAKLRELLIEHFEQENSVRAEGYRQALSAALHRLAEFGVEDTFENYSAIDLLNMTLVGSSGMTAFFIRTAAMRAVLEEDELALKIIEKSGLVPYVLGWYQEWNEFDEEAARHEIAKELPALLDDSYDDHAIEVARQEREAASISRLALGRRFPQYIDHNLLWEVKDESPLLLRAIVSMCIDHRADLFHSLRQFLQQHPDVLMARDPDKLLAPLVARSVARRRLFCRHLKVFTTKQPWPRQRNGIWSTNNTRKPSNYANVFVRSHSNTIALCSSPPFVISNSATPT